MIALEFPSLTVVALYVPNNGVREESFRRRSERSPRTRPPETKAASWGDCPEALGGRYAPRLIRRMPQRGAVPLPRMMLGWKSGGRFDLIRG